MSSPGAAAGCKRLLLTKNLAITGPPGSGKSFYGHAIAGHFGVPLYTASRVLRQLEPDLDLTSGRLVDCSKVASVLRNFFAGERERRRSTDDGESRCYILDGYPRTPSQIEIMTSTWPAQDQVHAALQLNVPDSVCEQKMLGRRQCRKCGVGYNVAHVKLGQWDLPPQLPKGIGEGEGGGGTGSRTCIAEQCCYPSEDWTRREDDTPEIVRARIREYRNLEAPILDYYESQGRLLRFTPYRGVLDIPELLATCTDWLSKL